MSELKLQPNINHFTEEGNYTYFLFFFLIEYKTIAKMIVTKTNRAIIEPGYHFSSCL